MRISASWASDGALDHVILKEDEDGRGRHEGIAALIREGLETAGMAPDEIEVVYDEFEALDHALAQAQDGDLVLVLANDVRGMLDVLRKKGATA